MSCKPDTETTKAMYELYLSGFSLADIGRAYAKTRQSVFERFTRAGLELRQQKTLPFIMFNGDKFTRGTGGYYRKTYGDRESLHRSVWMFHNGPIPDWHDIHHKVKDLATTSIADLQCLAKQEHGSLHAQRGIFDKKKCLFCGEVVLPHEAVNGRLHKEGPMAFSKRNFCGSRCSRNWLKGKPRGTKVEA